MGARLFLSIAFCIHFSVFAQKIDVNFAKNGVLVFKELGMFSSNIIDFDVLDEHKINVLFESDVNRYLVRFNENGTRNVVFDTSHNTITHELINPIAMSSAIDGGVLVLSDVWKENNWVLTIRKYQDNGYLDQSFGVEGLYENNILDNQDNNFGQHMYMSSKGEIIIVARVSQFHMVKETEKIAIIKVSESGITTSTKLYDDHHFNLNCSTMRNDQLLVAYSESMDNGAERATYIVGLDSNNMDSNPVDCLNIDSEYQFFNKLVIANGHIYASNIKSDLYNLYNIRKYDMEGNLDEAFKNLGEIDFNADIYNTDFVVNDIGELFIVSTSLDNEQGIIVTKLTNRGEIDRSFGDNGVTTVFLKYPITGLHQLKLDAKQDLYISGTMDILSGSFGFITKINLNSQVLKRKQLDKFIGELFKN
ncbi:hypothetical protein GCM10022393_30960 [Aquimarina addita]|uniref:Uncharacterized protein n=1 Tax=Aquimarina addita TaxID=870485 RepID=A0ABP6URB2_9FLAO